MAEETPRDEAPLDAPLARVETDSAPRADHVEVVKEAIDKFNRTSEFEALWRQHYRDDTKFSEGDPDNGWQWPGGMREGRSRAAKPSLTINITRQHNLQIINEARRAKSSVKVVPTGGDASAEAANGWKDLIRRIEYQSNAPDVYYNALKNCVRGGIGWWRIVTRYEDAESFNQDAYLMAIPDSMSVYIDPDCQQFDKSDARFAHIFGQIESGDFKETWPSYRSLIDGGSNRSPLGTSSVGDTGTWNEDSVWFCEYFRKVSKPITLVSFIDVASGARKTIRRDKLPENVWAAIRNDPTTRTRQSHEDEVQWFLIVDEKVVDSTIWPGKYIPLVPVVGEETVIDGILDRKGHTRNLKDAQRLYNYNASSQAEFVALQTRTPWVAPALAIEGVEVYWNRANVDNVSVLPYNHIDDQGNDIPPPQRPSPPQSAPGFEQGMSTAWQQMMMASGQWQNQMGIQGNERTGEAIKQRQGQADNAVAHFQDNFASALRYSGRQLIDIIPKLYDTPRVLRIMDDDGLQTEMRLDPRAAQAYAQRMNERGEAVQRILNPMIGKYDIAADVGPSYATKREETIQMLSTVITQAPAFAGIIGDLVLKNMDFDDALEAAQRLKRLIPPQALGLGPSQQEQALQQQLQQAQQLIQQLSQKLGKSLDVAARDRLKLIGKDQKRDIDVYDAETRRITSLQKQLPLDPQGLEKLVYDLVGDALQVHLGGIVKQNSDDDVTPQAPLGVPSGGAAPQANSAAAGVPPIPGAQRASDGQWYLSDPTRKGKWLRIAPFAQNRQLPKNILG